MKLHLPQPLRAALIATFTAIVSLGTAGYASTTYEDLTAQDYFVSDAHVYNTGKGTFYLETEGNALNLTLTLNLKALEDYQAVHDYANGGSYSPFVTWTYNNNPGSTYGMADVATGYSNVNYSGFTGYWAGTPWSTGNKITTETLRSNYADKDGNVTLTINNTPSGTTRNVVITATDNAGVNQTLYSADGLRSANYVNQHITSFTVNMNYVTALTLNTVSTLNSATFTPPKDYTVPFESERTDGTSVGRILFMGDSITHGVQDMTWRWDLFKTFVDNGIENEIAGPLSGYHSNPLNSDYNGNYTSSQYGGETFDNLHYAQSSGRTHNMLTASNSVNALGKGTGVNYGGVSSAKVGNEYNADTYVMMMGTNDILSDGAYNNTAMPKVTERLLGAGEVQNGAWVNADVLSALIGAQGTDPATAVASGKWGTMGQIIDNMHMDADDTMYIMSIPTWGAGRTGLNAAAPYVQEYNTKLELWVDAYNNSHTGTVKYVDINKGLVDKTRNGQFLAPDAFFRTTDNDYIHPNEQGALIIAGNLARGMGIGGRTAGLARSAADAAGWTATGQDVNLNAGDSLVLLTDVFTEANGYTIDFGATFGNGATNGWLDKSNALSVSVGDGINSGTLNISEGYISWGDKLLYCQDNSSSDNENIRIAFHNGNAEENVSSGYYVWLGDMLIGQGLGNQTSGLINGVSVSSVGNTATLTGLSYANTAYAPTTTLTTGPAYLTTQAPGNTDLVSSIPAMESHDNTAISSGVDWSSAADNTNQAGVNNASSFSEGKATVNLTNVGGWFAAAAVTTTGDVEARVANVSTGNNGFAVQAGTLTGNVTMEITESTVNSGSYSGLSAALAGSFNGATLTGTFSAYIDDSTLNGDMVGGTLHGTGSVGAVNFVVNNGAVNGSIYGGSKTAGTVGNGTADSEGNFSNTAVAITVNGGNITGDINGGGTQGTVKGNAEITITGGVIGGNITGGNIQGTSTVTVDGNLASIGGNITADTVKLQNVADSGCSDGFDKYKGTIIAENLVLDNYTAGKVNATLVTDYLTATNGTEATIHGLTLRNCSIDATGATALTLGESISSGNTISYSGNIRLEDGTSFTITNPTALESGHEGFSDGLYIYVLAGGAEGKLLAADGSALTGAHTATFTGTGENLAGKVFSYESSTGALIAHSSSATYTLTSSTVDYSGIAAAAGIIMSGGQLNLDAALSEGSSISASGGTVNIGEGVTLAAADLSATGDTQLAGSGVYNLSAKTLPSHVSLGDEWSGTVLLKDVSLADGNSYWMNALSKNGSVLELSGFSGYDKSWAYEDNTANIRLTDSESGAPAWAFSAATGNTGYDFSATGKWSGTGTFKVTGTKKLGYTFSGDISEWTGAMLIDASDATVTLKDSANVVNTAIRRTGGNVALALGTGSSFTFNNTVEVSSLSAAGKSVTLGTHGSGDTATHGSLTVAGSAAVGTLTVQNGSQFTGGNGTAIGTLNMNGGTFDITSGTATVDKLYTNNANNTFAVNVRGDATLNLKKTDANFGVQLGSTAAGSGLFVHDTATLMVEADGLTVKALEAGQAAAIVRTGMDDPSRPGRSQNYRVTASTFTVKDADIALAKNTATTMANKLDNSKLTNNGSGAVTVNHAQNTLVGLSAQSGAITVQNADSSAATLTSIKATGGDVVVALGSSTALHLTELSLGNGHGVQVTTQVSPALLALGSEPTPADFSTTINVSGTEAAPAVLRADGLTSVCTNLNLGGYTQLALDGASQGIDLTGHALTLTASASAPIFLTEDMMVVLSSSNRLTLFTNVGELNTGNTLSSVDGNDVLFITPAAAFFADAHGNALAGEYMLAYDASTREVFLAPEPATATLSLLALAGLAARRRRR